MLHVAPYSQAMSVKLFSGKNALCIFILGMYETKWRASNLASACEARVISNSIAI